MRRVSLCQWALMYVLGPSQGNYKVGDLLGMWYGFVFKTAAVHLLWIPGWLVQKAAFPSPLSQPAPGRVVVSIASPRQVALGSRGEILVLRSYSLYLTSQAAVCNLEQHCKCDCCSLGNEVSCFSDVVCIIRF